MSFIFLLLLIIQSESELESNKKSLNFKNPLFEKLSESLTSLTKCNVVVLAGGGSAGAIEVGFLKRQLENQTSSPSVDLITGVSAGALNAAVLSQYKNDIAQGLKQLEQQWSTIGNSSVYKLNQHNLITLKSLLDSSPEQDLIKSTLIELESKTDPKNKIPTLIGASNLNKLNFELFDLNELPSIDDKTEVVMASSAIPFVFPQQEQKGDTQVDGGLFSMEVLNGFLDTCSVGGFLKQVELNLFLASSNTEHVDSFASSLEVFARIASVWFGLQQSEMDVQTGTCNKYAKKVGKINIHSIKDGLTNPVNVINFDKGQQQIDQGYENQQVTTYDQCI